MNDDFPFKPGDEVTIDQLREMFPGATFVGVGEEPKKDLLIQTDLTADPENPDKVTLWLDVTQVMGPRDHDGDIPLDMIEQYPVLSMPREIWNKIVAIAAGGGEGELEFAAASLIESIQLELYSIDQDEGRIHPDVPLAGVDKEGQ